MYVYLYVCMCGKYVHMSMCVHEVKVMRYAHVYESHIFLGSLASLKLTSRLSWLAWNSQESPVPASSDLRL